MFQATTHLKAHRRVQFKGGHIHQVPSLDRVKSLKKARQETRRIEELRLSDTSDTLDTLDTRIKILQNLKVLFQRSQMFLL
jgi:hypothetical protein